MRVEFTCAVCPNGCRLAVELDGDGSFVPLETGRCIRGTYLLGKEYYFDGTSLVKLDVPLSKREVIELVEKRRG